MPTLSRSSLHSHRTHGVAAVFIARSAIVAWHGKMLVDFKCLLKRCRSGGRQQPTWLKLILFIGRRWITATARMDGMCVDEARKAQRPNQIKLSSIIQSGSDLFKVAAVVMRCAKINRQSALLTLTTDETT